MGGKEPIMAQKNIVVVDTGIKLVLFPRTKDAGTHTTLDAPTSKAVREYVQTYVQNDERELPYHDRLNANKRIGLKGNNRMNAGLRAIIKGQDAQDAPVQDAQVAVAGPERVLPTPALKRIHTNLRNMGEQEMANTFFEKHSVVA